MDKYVGRFSMYAVMARADNTPRTAYELGDYNTRYGYPAVYRALRHKLIISLGKDSRGYYVYVKA